MGSDDASAQVKDAKLAVEGLCEPRLTPVEDYLHLDKAITMMIDSTAMLVASCQIFEQKGQARCYVYHLLLSELKQN
eukprot:scaffold158024_cov19-Prasinocladus_malaysianus.AAC.1